MDILFQAIHVPWLAVTLFGRRFSGRPSSAELDPVPGPLRGKDSLCRANAILDSSDCRQTVPASLIDICRRCQVSEHTEHITHTCSIYDVHIIHHVST